MSIVVASAQNMVVKSFNLLDRDMAANTEGTSRICRQDGTTAALIKVVTTGQGFNFDGGSLDIVDVVNMPGEVWVYVPARLRKITITHQQFGSLREYEFPLSLQPARTYEMLLDPGVGRYVTIQSSVPRSTVYLDGDSLGLSPIYNQYVLYGPHTLKATNDRMEGEMKVDVAKDGSDEMLSFTVPMVDQSEHFGTVNITTDPDAEIVFNGVVKGIGRWNTDLREGNYVVETRRVNCDPSKTSFTVRAKQMNMVEAIAPVAHTGFVHLFCRPRDLDLSVNGVPTTLREQLQLSVGIQQLTFSRKGYHTLLKDYDIRQNVTLADTIELERIQYLKRNGFYFGGAYSLGQSSGATGIFGVLFSNFDLQLSYTFGLDKSKPVSHYDPEDNAFRSKSEYKVNTFSAKLGYQYRLATTFGIVPQVGIATKTLSCTLLEGSEPFGDGISSTDMTLGCKFIYSPVQHFCLFVAPEYDLTIVRNSTFDAITRAASFPCDGFYCHLGVIANF